MNGPAKCLDITTAPFKQIEVSVSYLKLFLERIIYFTEYVLLCHHCYRWENNTGTSSLLYACTNMLSHNRHSHMHMHQHTQIISSGLPSFENHWTRIPLSQYFFKHSYSIVGTHDSRKLQVLWTTFIDNNRD